MRSSKKIFNYFIFLIPFLFPSCALIVNKKFQTIHIYCDSTIKLNKVANSAKILDLDSMPAYLVKRNANALPLEFKLKDSSILKYRLPSELSPAFLFGNLYPIFPFGHSIDLFFPNKFRYHPNNYFSYDTARQKIIYTRHLPRIFEDGEGFTIKLGWSYLNAYHNSLYNGLNGGGSPFGLNGQLDYKFKKDLSLYLEIGMATMVVPRSPYRWRRYNFDNVDSITNVYSNNFWFTGGYKYHLKRLSGGVGLDFSPTMITTRKYYISHKDSTFLGDTISRKYNEISDVTKNDILHKIGFAFNVEYMLIKEMSAGMNWHFFVKDLNKGTGVYASHFFNFYITFNIGRINLNSKKKKHEYN